MDWGEQQAYEERLRGAAGQLNAAQAQIVALVKEALDSQAWSGAGIRSPSHYLTWKLGVSPATAKQLVEVAAAADTHPKISETFQNGALSIDQAAAAVKVPAHNDAEFAEVSQYATVTQIRTMRRATTPPADRPKPEEDRERVSFHNTDEGQLRLLALLDPDRGAIVDAALSAARDRLFHEGHTEVSWADALVNVCERSLNGEERPRAERFRINLFMATDHTVRLADGFALPDAIAKHLTCDGSISPIFTANGVPVSVGRAQHVTPDRTRRLVLQRDHGTCAKPGCSRTRGLRVHHIVHWQHGGPTDTANLITLCDTCHRQLHRGHFDVTGNADDPADLVFLDKWGDPLTPPGPPPQGRPPPERRRYVHPTGDKLDASVLWFTPPPDLEEPRFQQTG